jgi:glycosyltransferase involved in cell wall biosynthesis
VVDSGLIRKSKGREVSVVKGVSIIIPTFNRAELLKVALGSVQQLSLPPGWVAEVLVIDNNSSDCTPDVVQDAERSGPFPVRHFIERKQGLNFSRNRGASEAAFDHLIYFDDDMIVDEGWLEAYVDIRSRLQPDCVVGPVEPWFEEEPPDWMTSRTVRSVTSPYSRRGSQEMLLAPDVAHEIPGCNFAVLKSVVFEVGGFHPGLGRSGRGMLAGEDCEFGERIVELGKRVAYSPRCRIRHFISSQKISPAGLRARWTCGCSTQ